MYISTWVRSGHHARYGMIWKCNTCIPFILHLWSWFGICSYLWQAVIAFYFVSAQALCSCNSLAWQQITGLKRSVTQKNLKMTMSGLTS